MAAYTAAIDARLMTRERAEWELGGTDWNETFDQKLAEHRRLAANGLLPVPKAGAAAPQPNANERGSDGGDADGGSDENDDTESGGDGGNKQDKPA